VIILVAETLGYFVAVEFDRAATPQVSSAHAYGRFKGEQVARLSAHEASL
jgi:hypothetical protein